MSDEPITLGNEPPPAAPHGVVEHGCEHPGCSRWGGFGYRRHKLDEPKWFCYDHRSDGEALIGRRKTEA